jgi:hypothetical protein
LALTSTVQNFFFLTDVPGFKLVSLSLASLSSLVRRNEGTGENRVYTSEVDSQILDLEEKFFQGQTLKLIWTQPSKTMNLKEFLNFITVANGIKRFSSSLMVHQNKLECLAVVSFSCLVKNLQVSLRT